MAVVRARKELFSWTDDEVELLLCVTLEYKTTKIQNNVDWESCKLKYTEIGDLFKAQYPRTHTEKDFPHEENTISQGQLTAKLKQVRIKYRHAVDLGRRSGQGRVVYMYFELCEQIWGGSATTHPNSAGVETGDLLDIEESLPGPSLEHSTESPESSGCNGTLPTAAVVRHRRDLLQARLDGHRVDRMKRKLPAEHAVQEELRLKKPDVGPDGASNHQQRSQHGPHEQHHGQHKWHDSEWPFSDEPFNASTSIYEQQWIWTLPGALIPTPKATHVHTNI
ncbi:hypothetical protein OYC64_004726 [Pagothenia borchgrevinki]|uniref:Uncharacterized protein n=1 Tax=Pagothenia borchgrevinki TaxID=8213 RepID=A0ABD2GDI2_PAGBO